MTPSTQFVDLTFTMPAPNPRQRSRSWSPDALIGVVAVIAVVGLLLLLRPQSRQEGEDFAGPRPLQPVAREPLKLSERLRPRANTEAGAPAPEAPAAPQAAGGHITAPVVAAVTPSRLQPRADAPPIPVDNQPTARPGVLSDLEPQDIDLDDAADDITALTKVAFGDPDPERRLSAVESLAATEDPQVITALARSLADENEEVRMAALQALADFTGEAPAVAIEGALRDPSPDIRYEAVSMLADLDTDRARAAIRQALNDPDEEVRFLAESILELRKDQGPGARVVPQGGVGQPVQ